MMPANPANPPQLYSWTVIDRIGDPPRLGAVGVCQDEQRAVSRLTEALQDAPAGPYGVIHKVTVSLTEVGYRYGDAIICAEVDPGGEVVLNEVESRGGGWGA